MQFLLVTVLANFYCLDTIMKHRESGPELATAQASSSSSSSGPELP